MKKSNQNLWQWGTINNYDLFTYIIARIIGERIIFYSSKDPQKLIHLDFKLLYSSKDPHKLIHFDFNVLLLVKVIWRNAQLSTSIPITVDRTRMILIFRIIKSQLLKITSSISLLWMYQNPDTVATIWFINTSLTCYHWRK